MDAGTGCPGSPRTNANSSANRGRGRGESQESVSLGSPRPVRHGAEPPVLDSFGVEFPAATKLAQGDAGCGRNSVHSGFRLSEGVGGAPQSQHLLAAGWSLTALSPGHQACGVEGAAERGQGPAPTTNGCRE